MIIALLGYMGSGKSTLGKPLAQSLGYKFLDLDHFIEQQQGQSITDLFNSQGEIQFRSMERTAVETICRTHHNTVLALGGGTPCYGDTMSFLVQHPNVLTVYLKVSVHLLYTRLIVDQSKRPLIAHISQSQLSEFIAKHVFERSRFYNLAQLIVTTDNKSIETLIYEISEELN